MSSAPAQVAVADPAPGLEKQDSGISREVSARSRPGRKIRASITTRMVGSLQRQSQAMSSWVTGILFMDHDPGFDKLKEVVVNRMLLMPRFRSRMKARGFPLPQKFHFRELDLADFDHDYHVKQVLHEGAPVSEAEVIRYVETMYSGWEPDLAKPLWQIEYVPRLDDGRAVVITRISHAIGDGVSQVEVLLRLLDPASSEEEAEAQRNMAPPKKRASKKKAFGPLTRARIFMGGVWTGFFSVFSSPDPSNSLRPKNAGDVSAERRFAFTDPIPLERMKEVKSKLEGATINDVLITVLTLTFRAYFEEQNETKVLSGKSKVTTQFPISTRGRNDPAFRDDDPRNKWAYGYMALHVRDKGSPVDLFWKIKRDLDKVKLSPAPIVQTQVAKSLIPFLPLSVLNNTALTAANKSTAQISNVAAPSSACTMAGASVTSMAFILMSPLALYAGICSFNGSVTASFCLDANLKVDPNLLAKHWAPQFERLYAEVMEQDGVMPARRNCLDCL